VFSFSCAFPSVKLKKMKNETSSLLSCFLLLAGQLAS
jgi:hypothetical protein